MITAAPLLETSFPDLTLHGRGKVRDIYRVGDDLLIVATDRIFGKTLVMAATTPAAAPKSRTSTSGEIQMIGAETCSIRPQSRQFSR